jgi:hypothetical protein
VIDYPILDDFFHLDSIDHDHVKIPHEHVNHKAF